MSKFMRIMVFFDLPVVTAEKRRTYSRFRKFLINDGYVMLQLSVYSRICNGLDAANTHIKRLKQCVPAEGSVRYMIVTEKQYASMGILVGGKKPKEKKQNSNQISFL